MSTMSDRRQESPFNAAEVGALAHLYRGEMYRSKVWRTRLDTTTNWAVATTGIALSVTFVQPENSPLPLILVGLLVVVFWFVEARRYRYFDIWRTRVRLMEVCFYGPILRGEGVRIENRWDEVLASDYLRLHFHISLWEAAGRRLRRNYAWIFAVLGVSCLAKIWMHPTPLRSLDELWARAAMGPVSGEIILLVGVLGYLGLFLLAVITLRRQHAAGRVSHDDYDDSIMRFEIHV